MNCFQSVAERRKRRREFIKQRLSVCLIVGILERDEMSSDALTYVP